MLSFWQSLPHQPKKGAVGGTRSTDSQGAGLRPAAAGVLWVANSFCLELKQEVLWPCSCADLPGCKAKPQSGNITNTCFFLRWHLLWLCTKYGANQYPNTFSCQWKKFRNIGSHRYHNENATLSFRLSLALADNPSFVDLEGAEQGGFAYSNSLSQLRRCFLEPRLKKARGENPEQEQRGRLGRVGWRPHDKVMLAPFPWTQGKEPYCLKSNFKHIPQSHGLRNPGKRQHLQWGRSFFSQ